MQNYAFKIFRSSLYLFCFLLSLSGCRDFTEEDLVETKVLLTSPVDKYQSTNSKIIFKWTEVQGADNYLFEIASPDFSTGAIIYDSIIYDSTLTDERLELSFFPGQYQWRVKGFNNSSSTDYSEIRNFTIDQIIDLSDESVNIVSPIGLYNVVDLTFRWQELFGADSYTMIIRENSWETGVTWATSTTELDSTRVTGLKEGAFVWGVRAENLTPSVTDYTKVFFEIDTTRPDPSIITFPNADTFNLGNTVTINWSQANPVGVYPTSVLDSVFVYSDSLVTLHKSYSTSSLSQVVGDLNSSGTYYCRMKTYDVAGNVSAFSDANFFVIQ
jgi:hypothetical protein